MSMSRIKPERRERRGQTVFPYEIYRRAAEFGLSPEEFVRLGRTTLFYSIGSSSTVPSLGFNREQSQRFEEEMAENLPKVRAMLLSKTEELN
jgi:hypothetical protein